MAVKDSRDDTNIFRPPGARGIVPPAPVEDRIESANAFCRRFAGVTFALSLSTTVLCATAGVIIAPGVVAGARTGRFLGFLFAGLASFIAVMFAYQFGDGIRPALRKPTLLATGVVAAVVLLSSMALYARG